MSVDYRERVAAIQRGTGKDWFKVEAKTDRPKAARIDIYDEIGFWGTSAKGFLDQVKALDAEQIDVHINSPGGEAYDALAIYNTLRDHPATVTVTVDGVAASSASVIAMAGDEVVMNRGSELMVHQPFGLAVGNADDMRGLAEVLDKASSSLAGIYAGKAGGTVAQWLDVMSAETWYTAQEAVDAHLADRIVEPAKNAADVKARFDFTIYNYAGRDHAPAPRTETQTPAATVSGPTEQKEQGMSDKLVDSLRQRLGIADENPDEDALLTALDQRLAEKKESPTPQANMDLKEVQKVAAASGFVMVDKNNWDETRAKLEEGVQANAKLREMERDTLIDQAVTDGRIPPASKPVWASAFDKDPKGTSEVIAQLQKNVIPVQALGYGTDLDDTDGLPADIAGLFPKER